MLCHHRPFHEEAMKNWLGNEQEVAVNCTMTSYNDQDVVYKQGERERAREKK